jgi:hypothetical protein
VNHILVGGLNPSEKYESQWEGLSHILWKIKNVPNYQPEYHSIFFQGGFGWNPGLPSFEKAIRWRRAAFQLQDRA